MKNTITILILMAAIVPFILWASAIGFAVYGLVLAFKASVVLGVIALIVEPSPLILGVVAFFGQPDVAHKLAAWLGLS